MAITEESRHRLYQRLEELLGTEQATTLMEHLPPVGWGDVATKRDLDHLAAATKQDLENHRAMTKRDLENHRAMTKRDLENLRAMTKRDIDNLGAMTKRDIDNLGATTKRDLDHLGATTKQGMESAANAIRAEVQRDLRAQLFAMLAANATLAGLVFAAARLT